MPNNILGRGLDSLIPPKKVKEAATLVKKGPVTASFDEDRVEQIPVDRIEANPHQPRTQFNHQQLEELIGSIQEHGIIQPLVVTRVKDKYQLIAGERRLRAAKLLNLPTVPVIVRQAGEQEKLELSLIENIQRENLNPIEEALAYRLLVDEFNLTHKGVSKKIGKSASAVTNHLRLLNLPTEIQQALIDGQITAGHGKVIAGVAKPEDQTKFFKKILKNQLTVRETEQAAHQEVTVKGHTRRLRDPNLVSQEERLQGVLSTKVKIDKKKEGSGKIIIEFYSVEELEDIINRIVK